MTRRTVSGSWKVRTTSRDNPRQAKRGPSMIVPDEMIAGVLWLPTAISWRNDVSPRWTPSTVVAQTRTPEGVMSRP